MHKLLVEIISKCDHYQTNNALCLISGEEGHAKCGEVVIEVVID